MSLGTNLYALRAKAGLSQDALAEKLEVSRQSVSKWETDASVPELEKLIKLAELFGVSLDELILDRKPEPAQTGEPIPEAPMPEALPAGTPVLAARHRPGARTAGIVLLTLAGLALLSALILGITALMAAAALALAGVLCFVCRKRPALWACWTVYGMASLWLGLFTGAGSGAFVILLFHPELMRSYGPPTVIVSAAALAAQLAMAVWTVLAFRKTALPRNAVTLALAAALWLLRLAALPWVMQTMVRHILAAGQRPGLMFTLLNTVLSCAELAAGVAAVTVTVCLLIKREK